MSEYKAIFPALLTKASIKRSTLDERLQNLIGKFERVLDAVKVEQRPDLMNVLIQVDAIICVNLYKQYGVLPELSARAQSRNTTVNKVEAMALKAKALQLKWKTKKALSIGI